MSDLGSLSCLAMPLKCLLLMLAIGGIMIAPILVMFGPVGWVADAGVLITAAIGLMATTGGNLLKIFEK